MVTLRVSFIGWMFESVGCVICLHPLFTTELGPTYYLDTLIMFVVIPIVYFVNDVEVKDVIHERGWYQGLCYMVGNSNKIAPQG